MSASEREADEVKIPHLNPVPGDWRFIGLEAPKGWRYRRRILPEALARYLGKTEWKSPVFKQKWQAVRECERLKPIHDEIVARWKTGQAVDDVPGFAAAVEAKGQHLRTLREEALDAEIEAMEFERVKAWARSPGVAAAFKSFESERGGPVNIAETPSGPLDVSYEEFAARAGPVPPMTAVNLAALEVARDGGVYRPQTMPLKRAYERDKEQHGGKRDEKRIGFAVDAFVKEVGDIDFFALKRGHVEKWIKGARARGWSDATVKRRTVALQGIHSRLLIAFDLPASSVWRKLGLNDTASADDRVPLNAAHLKALDSHLGRKKTKAALALTIMRYTGVGPKELVGLRKRDFVLDHATPHVIVTPHEERGLKTDTRKRSVPLLGPALTAAKLLVKEAPSEFVFVKRMTANAAGSLSALGNKTLRAAGIPKSKRLTCYSLRHGLAEAMKLAGVREDLRKYVLGHSQSGVTEKYGASAPLLAETATALAEAHKLLGKIDDSVYEPSELMAGPTSGRRLS